MGPVSSARGGIACSERGRCFTGNSRHRRGLDSDARGAARGAARFTTDTASSATDTSSGDMTSCGTTGGSSQQARSAYELNLFTEASSLQTARSHLTIVRLRGSVMRFHAERDFAHIVGERQVSSCWRDPPSGPRRPARESDSRGLWTTWNPSCSTRHLGRSERPVTWSLPPFAVKTRSGDTHQEGRPRGCSWRRRRDRKHPTRALRRSPRWWSRRVMHSVRNVVDIARVPSGIVPTFFRHDRKGLSTERRP